jgi:ornithine carbamoyltransferase
VLLRGWGRGARSTSNFTLADLRDEVRVLSRYVDIIMARVNRHDDLLLMKEHSEVPVVNGLSDLQHPCQALADLMTIKEYFTALDGLTIAYIGDGNNVCNSLIEAATLAGMRIRVASPVQYRPDPKACAFAGSALTLHTDPYEAVQDADVIYTDTWVSMGSEGEREERVRALSSFQVNRRLVSSAPVHALIMHCLPAHREEEITTEVITSPNCVIFDQAENRRHVQKFLLLAISEGRL